MPSHPCCIFLFGDFHHLLPGGISGSDIKASQPGKPHLYLFYILVFFLRLIEEKFHMSTMHENHRWGQAGHPFFPSTHLSFLFSYYAWASEGLLSTQNDHIVISASQNTHPSSFSKCPHSVLPFLVPQMWALFF